MAEYTINPQIVEVVQPATITLTISEDDLRALRGALGGTICNVRNADGEVIYDAYRLYCLLGDAVLDLNLDEWSRKGLVELTAP